MSTRIRLYCLPYAGGSAQRIYDGWQHRLPRHLEVVPLELPARGTRTGERPVTRMGGLVSDVLRQVLPAAGEPYALFGHSLGGTLAFEVARELEQEHGRVPVKLLVSGTRAADADGEPDVDFLLPDDAFLERIRQFGGTPPEVLADDGLMELLLPVIRADFAAAAQWRYRPGPPLSCPITVFGGTRDEQVAADGLAGWGKHTAANCRVHLLPGGHFYVDEMSERLVALVAEELPSGLGG